MKTTLITGANRGIGLELVKQCLNQGDKVIACCRKLKTADELQKLMQSNTNLKCYELDVTDQNSIDELAKSLTNTPIDWLINNAGISGISGVTIGNIDRKNFHQLIDVNCLGPLKISEALLPNLEKGKEKFIAVISSRMGSISDNQRGKSYAYRTSKAALNCVMRSFAIDVEPRGIHVSLLHPGWVKTDMGGENAEIETTESVTRILKQMNTYKSTDHAQVLRSHDGSEIGW